MATAKDLLAGKEAMVHTIDAAANVLEATELMNEHSIGALVVTRDGEPAGMFTERDVLRRVVAAQHAPAFTPVEKVMTEDVVCCPLDADVTEIRSIMRGQKIRHLPVVDDTQRLVGLLSIGDLNAWDLKQDEVKIEYLRQYIYGRS